MEELGEGRACLDGCSGQFSVWYSGEEQCLGSHGQCACAGLSSEYMDRRGGSREGLRAAGLGRSRSQAALQPLLLGDAFPESSDAPLDVSLCAAYEDSVPHLLGFRHGDQSRIHPQPSLTRHGRPSHAPAMSRREN